VRYLVNLVNPVQRSFREKRIAAAKPTTLAAGKVAVLSLTAFGTAESDVIAAYAVEP
jgi:hypothetical protein